MTDAGAIRIARFAQGEEASVIDLILPIQREEFGIEITLADQPDLKAIPEFYQRDRGDFWVAKAAGRVVGTIGLRDIGNGEAALRKMFVAEAFRGRTHGVAARLLDHLLAESRRRGLTRIFLGTTNAFVAAHRFYEKHGFAEIEADGLPHSFPCMAVDTKFHVFRLNRPAAS